MIIHEPPTHEQRSIVARDLFGKPFDALSSEQKQSVFDFFTKANDYKEEPAPIAKTKRNLKSVLRAVAICVLGLLFAATLFNAPWKITQKRGSQIISTTTVCWPFWEQPEARSATAEIRWDIMFLEWAIIGTAFWFCRPNEKTNRVNPLA